MKAAAFSYVRATSVADALRMLTLHGDRAKLLSGGQSLMPAMNLRLLAPDWLIDVGALTELRGITVTATALRIGANTRHVDLANSPDIASCAPLLTEAIAHVAHPAIRNKGTLGGSLAHADPTSELPACMLALNATIVVQGPDGERRVAAADFFTGIYETALQPDELLVAVEIPRLKIGERHFFHEFARRHGDYAIAGLAAQAVIASGSIGDLRLAFFAVGDRPILATVAARKLTGAAITPAALADASAALATELDPQDDQQASAAMRRHLANVLLKRCMTALGRGAAA